jgi:phage tail sheath protein FI
MPVRPTYPGVYIEEIPSGVRPIAGVATSTAAFIGTFRKGLINEAVQLLSLADFEREYGGLDRSSEASYAVQQFFLNGGTEAWVVRIGQTETDEGPPALVPTAAARGTLKSFAGTPVLDFVAGRRIRGASADNPGDWGNFLRVEVEHSDATDESLFTLFVSEVAVTGNRTTVLQTETFRNMTMRPDRANYAVEVVNQGSRLIYLVRRSAPNVFDPPAASGTVSGDVADPTPASDLDDLEITLTLGSPPAAAPGMPVTLAFSGLPTVPAVPPPLTPGLFIQWTAALQAAIRNAGTDPDVLPEHRAYFTGATVNMLGDGSADNPRRFVIRAGKGSQPYDLAAQFSFGGTSASSYGLNTPTITGPQQIRPLTTLGNDGTIVDTTTIPPTYLVPTGAFRGNALLKTGLYALDDMDLVNIISMPDVPRIRPTTPSAALSVYAEAITYAENRRSMIIVDVPERVVTIDQMQTWLAENESLRHPNSVVYYPRTFTPDPLNQNRQRSLASSGTIGGLWARTDAARGVWKAPAGTDARLRNVESLTYVMTDLENGTLNPLGVNCLRNFPVYSNICWGARTLDGADALASDWKYVPVRRTTLYIEESLYRGTKWVVFEPNDEPLWAQIRLNVGAFMHDLFRNGAFQGTTPREAYFVKCDGETTTQSDIDNGIVNIEVGFAPLKPAEFVIIKIQQIARVTVE